MTASASIRINIRRGLKLHFPNWKSILQPGIIINIEYHMQPQQAIIIGSGIAGLAMATRLSVQGYQVSVYEVNDYPGRKTVWFLKRKGTCFDAGPSLFTQPQNIEELFHLAGEPIEAYFTYEPVEVACRYFFEGGKQMNAFTDKDKFAAELAEKTGEDPSAVVTYLANSGNLFDKVGTVFLNHSLHKKSTWLHHRVICALRAIKAPYLFGSLNAFNEKNFKSKEAVQIFNRFATYNGSNPYKAPGMLSLIPHLEQNQGTYYPAGGMISITNALYQLALKKGVEFHFNSKVERIINHEGQVRGVVVNGQNIPATLVVSNADVYFTYKNLLNHTPKANKLLKLERSSSALIFYGYQKGISNLGYTTYYSATGIGKNLITCSIKKHWGTTQPFISTSPPKWKAVTYRPVRKTGL